MKNLIYIAFVFILVGCGSDGSGNTPSNPDSFKRKEMLTFWAEQIIIPGYTDFNTKTNQLNTTVQSFTTTPSVENLNLARDAWKKAYIAWQKVSMFQVGKAQDLNMVNCMNTIPASTEKITSYAISGTYNLESPNLYPVQGFPALDYLLNGLGTDNEIVIFYTSATNASKYKTYLNDITKRVADLTKMVSDDWTGSYKQTFIDNDGYTDVSSVDKLVNFYIIPFFEKELRDNKIATPSGARTGEAESEKVEGYYNRNISKELFTTALLATKNFFKGIGNNGVEGKSLQQYLEFLKRKDLVDIINAKFDDIDNKVTLLNDDFASQIESDKTVFLNTYDSLQSLLKSFKPDMMSALSIKNNSTDADND
ncbi:imelysin family protein [Tenacibaculum pacificus]|uniref:imelysin family protein n=1 Tax=Tenacibaculum pacificus TaxID=3018314 RepID=UPI0022F38FBD|nr:imelysin family protein [Tenacibaculum pacificus]WBX72555.1 imelysin family protein [Tenacibaculum pacificus]